MTTFKTALTLTLAAATVACTAKADSVTVKLNGRIEAPLVDLAPKVAGRVVAVTVKEGDRVKAGDLLIQLDLGDTALAVERDRHGVDSARARLQDLSDGSRRAEVRAAEAEVADRQAAVELARREVQRQEFLISRNVGVERDYDRAKTELDRAAAAARISEEKLALTEEGFRRSQTEQARSDVRRAQTQLRQSEVIARESEIRAPADGIVMHRLVEPGQLLAAGRNGLTLALTGRLYVRTFVPETKLGLVRQGESATVSVDAFPRERFDAVVTEISPDAEYTPKAVETKAERINLVYGAKVDLASGWSARLVPGQPAEVLVTVAPAAPARARR
jgi:multidrug resistance efflux pump